MTDNTTPIDPAVYALACALHGHEYPDNVELSYARFVMDRLVKAGWAVALEPLAGEGPPNPVEALTGAVRWLEIICDDAGIDTAETALNAYAVDRETGVRRVVGTVTLAHGLEQYREAIAKAKSPPFPTSAA